MSLKAVQTSRLMQAYFHQLKHNELRTKAITAGTSDIRHRHKAPRVKALTRSCAFCRCFGFPPRSPGATSRRCPASQSPPIRRCTRTSLRGIESERESLQNGLIRVPSLSSLRSRLGQDHAQGLRGTNRSWRKAGDDGYELARRRSYSDRGIFDE
jgi:hypothetical protein